MPRSVVISHFFNEEYLLPWWLKHHVPLFDHGVLIDYNSTDRSVEICRELAPTWELRPSRNSHFDARQCDAEVMDIEREFAGSWKIALNTTEFFCTRDMQAFLWALKHHGWSAYAIRGLILVDPPAEVYEYPAPSRELPLVAQRFHGYFEDDALINGVTFLSRSRLLHRHDHGHYEPGRHWSSTLSPYMHPPGALLAHFLFSPFGEEFLARKLQIQTRIPDEDKAKGYGTQHLVDLEQLLDKWRGEAAKAIDLRNRPDYLRILGGWSEQLAAEPPAPRFFPASGYPYGGVPQDAMQIAGTCLRQGVTHNIPALLKLCEGVCRNLLSRDPCDTRALNLYGILQFHRGERSAAEALFNSARIANADFHEATFNLARVLAASGRVEEAHLMRNKAVALRPEWAALPEDQMLLP